MQIGPKASKTRTHTHTRAVSVPRTGMHHGKINTKGLKQANCIHAARPLPPTKDNKAQTLQRKKLPKTLTPIEPPLPLNKTAKRCHKGSFKGSIRVPLRVKESNFPLCQAREARRVAATQALSAYTTSEAAGGLEIRGSLIRDPKSTYA